MVSKVQKISIALPMQMVKDIRYAVDSGRFATVSEVIRHALRQWSGLRRRLPDSVVMPKTKKEFRKRIQGAIDSLDRGEGIPAEEVFDHLKKKYRTKAAVKNSKKRKA